MSALGNTTGEMKTRQKSNGRHGQLDRRTGLLVIGYPPTPATIRMLLLGWILIVVAVTRFALRRRFQTAECAVTVRSVPARSTDCGGFGGR